MLIFWWGNAKQKVCHVAEVARITITLFILLLYYVNIVTIPKFMRLQTVLRRGKRSLHQFRTCFLYCCDFRIDFLSFARAPILIADTKTWYVQYIRQRHLLLFKCFQPLDSFYFLSLSLLFIDHHLQFAATRLLILVIQLLQLECGSLDGSTLGPICSTDDLSVLVIYVQRVGRNFDLIAILKYAFDKLLALLVGDLLVFSHIIVLVFLLKNRALSMCVHLGFSRWLPNINFCVSN